MRRARTSTRRCPAPPSCCRTSWTGSRRCSPTCSRSAGTTRAPRCSRPRRWMCGMSRAGCCPPASRWPSGRGLPWSLSAPDEPCVAELDPRRMERVLRNLVSNAIEHGEGRPVEVRVAADAEAVAVGVRDHGVGLRPGEAALVFNRFWRADPARARTTGGTGLGLAIALEDTRLHGGWLQAWGQPGDGSHFRVTVPRKAHADLEGSPLPLEPADARSERRVPVAVGVPIRRPETAVSAGPSRGRLPWRPRASPARCPPRGCPRDGPPRGAGRLRARLPGGRRSPGRGVRVHPDGVDRAAGRRGADGRPGRPVHPGAGQAAGGRDEPAADRGGLLGGVGLLRRRPRGGAPVPRPRGAGAVGPGQRHGGLRRRLGGLQRGPGGEHRRRPGARGRPDLRPRGVRGLGPGHVAWPPTSPCASSTTSGGSPRRRPGWP